MQEITLQRKDSISGFENETLVVHVNGTQRRLKNGQTVVLIEELPASVQIFLGSVQTFEGHINARANGPSKMSVGITPKIAEKARLSSNAEKKHEMPKPAGLSAQGERIKQVMDTNARWMTVNKLVGITAFFTAAIFAVIGLIAMSQPTPGFAWLWGGIAVCCTAFGLFAIDRRPACCSQCGAPTLTCTNREEQFMGARSEQRIVINRTNHREEQITVTVSDMDVTEKWVCVSCNHGWSHKYSYTKS